MRLTREQILQADDLPKQPVPVPEWGGEVYVRTLTGHERDAWEAECVLFDGRKATTNMDALNRTRARLCARCICDETGKRLFTDEDIEALGAKSAAALDRVYEVAAKLNKVSKEDLEELAKN